MGMLAKHICAKQGCRVLTTQRFCPDHTTQPIVQRREFDNQRAEDPIRQLYFTPQWRATRNQVIVRDPICVVCKEPPTSIADHKIPAKEYLRGFDPKSEEGQRRFCDLENLQGVCKSCHDSKTAKETNSLRRE